MTSLDELQAYFQNLDYKLIIAADGETRTHRRKDGHIVEQTPAGGVSVAFDILCQAADATYVARGKTDEDREVAGPDCKTRIVGQYGSYDLKRVFISPEEEAAYYAGFANQTLWPLSHIAFQRPIFRRDWFDAYADVNRKFARSIEEEIDSKSFVWINDYQLALVPGFLEKRDDTVIGLFWHIPWPTWEIFRILPYKREILQSFLSCDFIGFHRRYQVRNFLNAVDRELGARIDFETNTVYVDGKSVRVASLPMGIDVDVVREAACPDTQKTGLLETIRATLGLGGTDEEQPSEEEGALEALYAQYKVILGVDRLDYTKGIKERLLGLDQFFDENPQYVGKAVYVGIMSPTREAVPAYQELQQEVDALTREINDKHRRGEWEPLHMVRHGFHREDAMQLYARASVCLVTPLDDGMNLVSKEFVVAASCTDDPGMLVLSQFAGSASDLGASILVNPYDRDALADAIKAALEMDPAERRERIGHMVSLLEDHNVYNWAMSFVRGAVTAAREQQNDVVPIH